MIRRSIVWIKFGLFIIALCFLGMMQTVHAMTVSPTRHTLIMEREQTNSLYLDVTNDSTSPITVIPSVESFSLSDQGKVQFGSPNDAISWITPREKTVILDAKETKTILFDVSVPDITTPGARYLVLFAEEQGTTDTVQVTKRVGSLVFLYVEGEIQESVQQTMLHTKNSVYFVNPITVDIEYKNTGNIHIIPFGTVSIKNRKGEIIETIKLNEESQKILAGGSMKQTILFPPISWKHVGPISVESQITYGITQKTLNQSITVWFIPKQLLVIAFGSFLIGGILVGAIYMYGHQKKHQL